MPKAQPQDDQIILSDNLFPVVGIGASAGGLNAFKKFLAAIPPDSGMAYVLVQHLHPGHESFLPELLQKITSIPVKEITDDVKVQADHIYIIPSNKMLVANDGVLQLSPRPNQNPKERNLPIDLFFTSLAEVHQSHAIGVILTGTGSDGTLGLKNIKAFGGLCFAQDIESAEYKDMPQSAIAAGVIDFILTPESMPGKLLELKQHIIGNEDEIKNLSSPYEEDFKKILQLLFKVSGTDFTHYKQTTVRRRILRRIALNKHKTPGEYLDFLKEHKPEQDILFQDLLIPVTGFFRDTPVFEHLCNSIFASIEKNNITEIPIRLWVAGCSTGQEAYSLAMCILEYLEAKKLKKKVQLFATDINESAINSARKGFYKNNEVINLSSERLKKFFIKSSTGYQANKSIRDICVFAVHDFLNDPPFTKMDFISCRNVLIYMEPWLQKKAFSTFHYALNPGGILLLGKSETTGVMSDLFVLVSKEHKFFCRRDVPATMHPSRKVHHTPTIKPAGTAKPSRHLSDFQKSADEILLSKYTPAGVVINAAMDILHFRGRTSDYLEQLPGKPSHNILQMAKNGLGFELRSLIHKAAKTKTTSIKNNIPFHINNIQRNISIEVILMPDGIELYYLILFYPSPVSNAKAIQGVKINSKTKPDERDKSITQLEKELAQNREDMRSITEDQEAVNEELQSANEELLSSSEELQSLNEELESSKEELQSTNEELTVLNQQSLALNEKVTTESEFAKAIIGSLHSPLLVLDKNLRIKMANTSFYKTFLVNEPETLGRLIYDIGNKQWDIPALRDLLEHILPGKNSITDFEVKHRFPSIGERVMLVNVHEVIREKAREKLILLTLVDITEKSMFAIREKELLDRFHKIVLQSPVGIAIIRGNKMIVEIANQAILDMVGIDKKDFLQKSLAEVLPQNKVLDEAIISEVFRSGKTYQSKEIEMTTRQGGIDRKNYFKTSYQLIHEEAQYEPGVMCVCNDVTDQVIARKAMEAQENMVKNVMMTAPAFICTLNGPDHVFTLINDRFQELFGKRKLKGKAILDALPELAGQEMVIDKLDSVYKTGKPFVGIDVPILSSKDVGQEPEERYFNYSYQPIYGEEKEIFSVLVFGYEVTDQVLARNKILTLQLKHNNELELNVEDRTRELKYTNDILKQKYIELEKANLELKSFTYISSHDLQEPLRKIQTFTSRLLESEVETMTEKGKDYFNRLNNAAKRMQTLIQDLLAYSHSSINEHKYELTDMDKLVTDVTKELTDDISEKKISIEKKKLGMANINVFQFKQVITNLVSNSIKFCRKDIPRLIQISSDLGQGSDFKEPLLNPSIQYYHIQFSDNGIGFQMIYKDRIFEVFQRLHGKAEYEGTGIGLAIVKKIVENHNGLIKASSGPGLGASFDIYIPN